MLIAVATRERAECLGRHVGAVLVREGRIVATGYNGTPRGFLRCNEGSRAAIAAPTASSTRAARPTTSASACTPSRTRCCRRRDSATRSTAATATRRSARASAASRSCARRGWSASSTSTRGQPGGEAERGRLRGAARAARGARRDVEQLDLDPAVLAARCAGAPRRSGRRRVRRPPPIAALFTVLATGLAVIAVGAWGGGAQVPAVAAAVLAAWMAGLVVRLRRSLPAKAARRRRFEDSVDSSLTRGIDLH